MKVIAGLGNPGLKYKNTRHNVGFRVVDAITQSSKFKVQSSKFEKRFKAEVIRGKIENQKVVLINPQTFMNNSGESVGPFLKYFKIKPEDLIIIHDDVDLSLGTVKIAFSEGTAGHKGIISVVKALGSQKFWRIRVGILSKPKEKIDTEKFVLEKFSKSESAIIEKVIKEVSGEFEEILKKGIEAKKIIAPKT